MGRRGAGGGERLHRRHHRAREVRRRDGVQPSVPVHRRPAERGHRPRAAPLGPGARRRRASHTGVRRGSRAAACARTRARRSACRAATGSSAARSATAAGIATGPVGCSAASSGTTSDRCTNTCSRAPSRACSTKRCSISRTRTSASTSRSSDATAATGPRRTTPAGRTASAPVRCSCVRQARFLTTLVLRGGWRDGWQGVAISALAAVSVGAKYAHLWALQHEHKRAERAEGLMAVVKPKTSSLGRSTPSGAVCCRCWRRPVRIRRAGSGDGSGRLGHTPFGVRRNVVERQIAAAFPDASATQVDAIGPRRVRSFRRSPHRDRAAAQARPRRASSTCSRAPRDSSDRRGARGGEGDHPDHGSLRQLGARRRVRRRARGFPSKSSCGA